jgi:hypothetical protein
MDFLDKVIADALPDLPVTRHEDFFLALNHSLTVDPAAYTPASFEPFGFTQRELYDLRVLLLRPLAYQFLHELEPPLTESALNRKTSFDTYGRRFGRDPWLISLRPRIMILTYTEWMLLALGEVKAIELPDVLKNDS